MDMDLLTSAGCCVTITGDNISSNSNSNEHHDKEVLLLTSPSKKSTPVDLDDDLDDDDDELLSISPGLTARESESITSSNRSIQHQELMEGEEEIIEFSYKNNKSASSSVSTESPNGTTTSSSSSTTSTTTPNEKDGSNASGTAAADKKEIQQHASWMSRKLMLYLIAGLVLLVVLLATGLTLKDYQNNRFSSSSPSSQAAGDGGGEDGKKEKEKEKKEDQEEEEEDALALSTPTTLAPTVSPSSIPTTTIPSTSPSTMPTTSEPSLLPSTAPSTAPSTTPTTSNPSSSPTQSPTTLPTMSHSSSPTTPSPTTATSSPTRTATSSPTSPPTVDDSVTYRPGKLTVLQAGLLLSEGLMAREIAISGQNVVYANGDESQEPFHGLPDGAETFWDTRPENPGGWIYVSNSEMPNLGEGGVGAITFDKDGNIINYRMILKGTTMNCSGGGTPWGTWVSCEELEYDGQLHQVDPTGQREPQVLSLGERGGRWEAFTYDIRNLQQPRFFASEDHNRGCVRRYTPDPSEIDWENDPWSMLHGNGVTEYLMLHPIPGEDGGTFEWTSDRDAARRNTALYYPQTEGIDCHEGQLFFVCKNIRQIFTVNLDEGTYTNATTVTGLFDGKPDQMQRILDDPTSILYFTEEGGVDAGVHARDFTGGYYTILESPEYSDETSGLAFSPNAMHMYIAYQQNGRLFDVWREDGLPFNAKRLDVKYHGMNAGRH